MRTLDGQQVDPPDALVGDLGRMQEGRALADGMAEWRERSEWVIVRMTIRRNWNGYSEDGVVPGNINGGRDQDGASGSGKQGAKAQVVEHDEEGKQTRRPETKTDAMMTTRKDEGKEEEEIGNRD
jgi:hypothetical protein